MMVGGSAINSPIRDPSPIPLRDDIASYQAVIKQRPPMRNNNLTGLSASAMAEQFKRENFDSDINIPR